MIQVFNGRAADGIFCIYDLAGGCTQLFHVTFLHDRYYFFDGSRQVVHIAWFK
jgi:hypothetical protein